ncbi:ClpXP protease specificity-enhancing factor [Nitrosomonas sp. Nm166]|uniref:ClpXP protease specificity-enhancing factor n=1 Tax=Nitrosomonas sp. Nm166 TaxID=1881054 RepID=UPI0008E9035A|nr:ClpXP protease specificity-enhancing factor [Nitrosomonas sp. Nm166]SFE97562.1 stringent starvation protein B [Nitrosomonas sp. Nm166]
MSASTKPYLIRSIYDWCIDSNFTPYISVKIYPELDIPLECAINDEIVFNISVKAAHDLIINNDFIYFMARFNGVSRKLKIPMSAVKGIFAKEVHQGIEFPSDKKDENQVNNEQNNTIPSSSVLPLKNTSKPNLRVVK